MSVLIVGSIAFDTLHLPSQPAKPFVKVLGGSASYASIAASMFAPVGLVGVVGGDFPSEFVDAFRSRNIDISGLETKDGLTFHWEGKYNQDLTARESLATDLNVFATFEPRIPESVRATPYVMLGNIQPTLQMQVLEQMQKPRLVIADTMNYWIDSALHDLKQLLRKIDILIINEEEARQLAQAYNILTVGRTLAEMGPTHVVIKRGEYGALLFEQGKVFSAPAQPLQEVIDPTGAGDTFAGGFLGYLAQAGEISSTTLRRAVIYGSAMASFCVEDVGPRKLLQVTTQQLKQRFAAFKDLAHFEAE
jgi:sugar/nucleoside kinase (ribokinase family)